MTEGNEHIIDPAGDARRALRDAVAEHGPQALSDAVIMDGICRDRLTGLPGVADLIGSAARTDVPALLRDLIPRLGNYGAIQSAASTLAGDHRLDMAGCLWVVREFARALGYIASGRRPPASAGSRASGLGPRPGSGSTPGAVPGPGLGASGSASTGSEAAPSEAGARGAAASGSAGSGAFAGGTSASGAGGGGAAAGGTGGGSDPGGGGGAGGGSGAEGGGGAGSPAGPGVLPGRPGDGGTSRPGDGGTSPPGDGGTSPPGRSAARSGGFGRNTLGIAAAIALVAGYLGVAAVAHLSPFPARTVAATSSQPAHPGNSTSASPDASPDPSPTSDYQILLSKIPSGIQGQNNCHNIGTSVGATAVSQCTGLHGLAAGVIYYYLFSDLAALRSGFNTFLRTEKFKRGSACTNNNIFVDFIAQCESDFTSSAPRMTGSIAEYANRANNPIIVSSDNQQLVMAVMVGTNDRDLLAYWKQLGWVVRSGGGP